MPYNKGDPGGKPSIFERVVGDDRQALLMSAVRYAYHRGDVGVILIVEELDAELSDTAD